MQRSCVQCQISFDITPDDLAFYEKVSPVFNGKKEMIPPPTLCPPCRQQRRLAWRNERHLYRRACDFSGESMISYYAPDSLYPAFDKETWWSDQWDPMEQGMELDRNVSFFQQLNQLRRSTPHMGIVMSQDEGSAFSSYCVHTKNCYLCISCVINEDSYYCYQANKSRNCTDCSLVTGCELCYECLYATGLYDSSFCVNCENGNGLFLCSECHQCKDCIGCVNLIGKEHWILNQPATAEACASLRRELQSQKKMQEFRMRFQALAASLPVRAAHLIQCENATGDHLHHCRNCKECFDAVNLENCAYVYPLPNGARDIRDAHYSPDTELVYEGLSTLRASRSRFALYSWDNEDVLFTDECFFSDHLFGCCGLRHKQYCILNKQYTKEEYDVLVPKIIEKMKADGEWGEFFPVTMSPFAYNETVAQEYFPLTKEEVLARGWKWRDQTDEMPKVEKILPAAQLPDSIDDIPDDILNWAIECEATKRPFKIIKQELEFYRTMKLPVPRFHPDERHRRRMALRNPRKLWDRECAKCHKPIATSYPPERPEIVFCEECYLAEVY